MKNSFPKNIFIFLLLFLSSFLLVSCTSSPETLSKEKNCESKTKQEGLLLAAKGTLLCNIVIPERMELIESEALEELSHFLAKAVPGSTALCAFSPVKGKCNIYLDTIDNKKLAANFSAEKLKRLKREGYALKIAPEGIYILGKDPSGVLYGVYGLLRKHIGYRWFHPGPDGEHTPSYTDLILPFTEEYSSPGFATRWPGGDLNRSYTNNQAKWHVRNGLQLACPKWIYFTSNKFINKETMRRPHLLNAYGGHELSDLMCKRVERAELFKKHPEYFGMVQGKRILKYWGVQPCLSNPAVFERIYQGIKQILMTTPRGGVHTIGSDDTPQFCECNDCMKGIPEEEKKENLTSTQFFRFVQKVRDRLKKERVPGELYAWGYHNYVQPPKGDLQISKDIRIYYHAFSHCHAHALDDPSCALNVDFLRIIKAWQKKGISMLFNEVTSCLPQSCYGGDTCRIPDCRAVVYMPMERMTARTLRKYHELKVKGVSQFMAPYEIRYPGKLFTKNRRNTDMALSMWQQNYVLAQYLWSPETDFDTFFEDMGSKYYGRAWKQLKEIRLILFDLFEKGPHMFSGVPPQALGEMMSRPGAVEKIEKLFDEAEKAVKDSPLHLRRTEQERDYYNESLLKMYKWHKKNAKPALTLPKISSSLKIDGALTESAWKNAPILTGFLIRDTGKKQKAAFQVKAKYLCNEKYLYFGVEAKDPESKQLSAYTKTPSMKIYQDAYLDLFIKEPNGRDFYYQFTINPAGVCLEYTRNSGTVGKQISAGTLVKTKVLDDRVIFEIAIPVSKLNGKNLSGNKWKINIGWAPKLTGDMNMNRDPERKALCLGTDFHLSYLDFVVK